MISMKENQLLKILSFIPLGVKASWSISDQTEYYKLPRSLPLFSVDKKYTHTKKKTKTKKTCQNAIVSARMTFNNSML